jgi:regulator of sigma E protease
MVSSPLDAGLVLAAFDSAALLSKLVSVLMVLIGLSLVIFFHELGHFAVARWCNVFVERFSIGFGPILFSRKYGETEYALSAIPFGGYVKMLGQDDMDPSQLTSEDLAKDPRSYSSKSVLQRMAIISAGVSMNVITAVLFFAVAFGSGIETPPAIVGSLQPGLPAWEAGLKPGDRLTRIGSRRVDTFDDIWRGVAISSGPVVVAGVQPDGTTFEKTLVPNTATGRRMIGVGPAVGLQVGDIHRPAESVTVPKTPAAEAQPAFQPGDRIVGLDGRRVSEFFELQSLLVERRDRPVDFQVLRAGTGTEESIRVQPQPFRRLGLTMDTGKISAIVQNSPAEKNGIQVGDKILRVNARSVGTDIDPLKLPDYLASLAGKEVTLEVQREVKGAEAKKLEIRLIPENKAGWVERPAQAEVPLSAPAIGVAYYVIPTVLKVVVDSPAHAAGLKEGDRVKKVRFVLPPGAPRDLLGKDLDVDFSNEAHSARPANWAYVVEVMQLATQRDVVLVLSDNRQVRCTPSTEVADNWFLPGDRGLRLNIETIMLKSDGVLDAASMGLSYTWNSIIDLYLTLRNLFTGELSVTNLHGPLGIASVAYGVAQQGIPQLSLFLGLLSANLAVLNFLPIPVLDGGHMLFLMWEGVTRKRPSERVQIAATYLGMAFIVCLAVLVLYLDIVVHNVTG